MTGGASWISDKAQNGPKYLHQQLEGHKNPGNRHDEKQPEVGDIGLRADRVRSDGEGQKKSPSDQNYEEE